MSVPVNGLGELPAWASVRDGAVAHANGLAVFAPVWAMAMLFSIAGDHQALLWRQGPLAGSLAWLAIVAAFAALAGRRVVPWLMLLSLVMLLRYALALPVASNNKTIGVFMNAAILAFVWPCLRQAADDAACAQAHDRLRVIARALLAVMYFYGIFHKINTDFLDPSVSCAVALYRPLAAPLGLDGNVFGHHLSIWLTFIVEGIALVALYWPRWFAIGLVLGLTFHFVIPISAYSWYMDFSSLVLALYMLSMPREVSTRCHAVLTRAAGLLKAHALRLAGFFTLVLGIGVAVVRSGAASLGSALHLHHSIMILLWALYGGFMMVVLTRIALDHLPWTGQRAARQPLRVYALPALLFLTCLSPYLGLKTESSIAMFSNLHTEGGVTNHLLFAEPPYLFDYQQDVVKLVDSPNPGLAWAAGRGYSEVLFSVKERLRWHPEQWVTYRQGGTLHERVTAAHFPPESFANRLERKLLIFKAVDFSRPKPCTH